MKSFIFVLGILALVVYVQCGPPEGMRKVFQECKTEAGITEERRGPPDMNDPKANCMFACVMEKTGKMIDGKVDSEKLWEGIKKMQPNTDDTVKEKLDNCAKMANEKSDKCEVAGAMRQCTHNTIGHPPGGRHGPPPPED